MQKVITLTLLALTLASCGVNTQPGRKVSKVYKPYTAPLCKFRIEDSNDPLEVLLSEDPWGLYEDKVVIPYLPTPKSEELPTFNLVCIMSQG